MTIRTLNTAIGKSPKFTMATIITELNEQQMYRYSSTFHFDGKTCKNGFNTLALLIARHQIQT